MTIRSVKEGLALLGFTLHVTQQHVTLVHNDIEVKASRTLSRGRIEALLLNVPNWIDIIDEALSKEGEGGSFMKTMVNLNEEQLSFIEQFLRDTRESFSTTLNELSESDSKKDRRKFAAYWATLAELTVKCRIANRELKVVEFVPEREMDYLFPAIEVCTAEEIYASDTDMIKYYKGLGLKHLYSSRYGNFEPKSKDDSLVKERMWVHFFAIPKGTDLCVTTVPLYKEKEGAQ